MKGWRLFLALAVLLAAGVGASGYALIGSAWSISPVLMHLELASNGPPIAGTLIDGSLSWDAAAASALGTWNYYLQRLQFTTVTDVNTPGELDGANNVFFDTEIYGTAFSDGVLAITIGWNPPGNATVRMETDVVFNRNLNWNSYRGPLRTAAGKPLYDFRRVALHEFGHVVGLDHPDEAGQFVIAIMNSRISNTDALQYDDVLGAQTLYGARPGTSVLPFGAFVRPQKDGTITGSKTFRLMGTADTERVKTVFLVNSRLGAKKFFKAKGVRKWKFTMPLESGTNRVTLYVRGFDGVRRKVTKRVIERL